METEVVLAAVLRPPDDDTQRLVYADWLKELGDPRGKLIHLQREGARLPVSDLTCRSSL
jgi:uncharacterized protein (TIGR02996 family)